MGDYNAEAEYPLREIVDCARELVVLFRRYCPVDSEPGTSGGRWADTASVHAIGSALEEIEVPFDALHSFLRTDPRSGLGGSPEQAIADIYAMYANKSLAVRTAMLAMHEAFYGRIRPKVLEAGENVFRATLPTFSSSDLDALRTAADHLAEAAGLRIDHNSPDGETESAAEDKRHEATAQDPTPNRTSDTTAESRQRSIVRRPPVVAFRAWYTRDVLAISSGEPTQEEVAGAMTDNGIPATQGQVSRWLAAVEKYLKAGGMMPTVAELDSIDTVDPHVIDMGARQDGRTPRQRPRRDLEADSDAE